MQKIFCFTVLLLISHKSLGYNISELKEAALKHVEENMDYLRKIVNHTLTDLPLREQNLEVIIKHQQSVGQALVESSYVDVHKAQFTNNIAVILLNSYPTVFECIRKAESFCISDLDSYHVDRFLKPVADYKAQGEKIQSNNIRKWTEEYNNAVPKFTQHYEETVRDIIASTKEEEIGWLVRKFDSVCRDFNTVVTNVNVYISQTQLEVLHLTEKLTDSLRGYVRNRFDIAQTQMRNCFNGYNTLSPEFLNFTFLGSVKNDNIF